LWVERGQDENPTNNENLFSFKAIAQVLTHPLQVPTGLIAIELEYVESTRGPDDSSCQTG
jgi:hypothetical protein